MATTNTTSKAPAEKKYKIHVPRAGKFEDPVLFISVNGVGYTIPKGQEVEVNEEVYHEWMRSQAALSEYYAEADRMQEDTVKQAKDAGL